MANRRYNTQTRKMFDKGTGRPGTLVGGKNTKAKDMLDRNPNRTMSPETKRRLNDAILKKRKEAFERLKERKRQQLQGRKPGKLVSGKQIDKNPEKNMSAEDRASLQKAAERRRKFNKKKNKKSEDRTKAIEPVKKPKKNTIKDKLNKVGDMKVKDAAKAVGKGILAATPVGAVKNAADTFNKNFKFQSPIVRKNRKFGGR